MPTISKPASMSTIWAASGIKTAPTDLKTSQGWVIELPPYQTANYIENKQDQFNAHVNMHGMAEWDSVTEYQGGLSYSRGSDGLVYKCVATNINFDPTNPLNSNFWSRAFENFGSVAVVANALSTLQTSYGTLANLFSVSAARSNLSVYSRVETDVRYAALAGIGSQVFSVAPATSAAHAVRLDQINNLIVQATEAVSGIAKIASALDVAAGADDTKIVTPLKAAFTYLKKSDNLSTLTSVAAARSNLGLGDIATLAATSFLRTVNNLADVPSPAVARSNLGLTSTATQVETYFLRTANNLSDLPNDSTARSNLGLGNAATRNIGTTSGTVATGDDSRIVNAVQTSRGVYAGNGLFGGGNLAADRTISLGTPSTIGSYSSNSVGASNHSHAFDLNSFFGDRSLAATGYYILPGGLLIQWGRISSIPGDGQRDAAFARPFGAVFQVIGGKINFTPNEGDGNACGAYAISNSVVRAFNDSITYANSVSYIAIGLA